jgi:thiol-disulfide isomerase/thioredoxin
MIKKLASASLIFAITASAGFAAESGPAKETKSAASQLSAPAGKTQTAEEKQAADKAWEEVARLSKPPSPPADWKSGEPTEAQKEAFKKQVSEAIGTASEKARDFYIKYPNDPRAIDAQKKERMLLMNAIQMGQTNRQAQLKLNPILSDEEKFQMRVNEVNKKALEQQPKGMDKVIDAYISGIKELEKEFPNRDELSAQMLSLMRYMEPEQKAAVAKHILEGNAEDSIKEAAKSILKTLPGQPVSIKFTAIDGREVDTEKLKGKVVLVDFWATWCGPCMRELPNVKAAYKKYHDKGFEIVSISGDHKLADLQKIVKRENIPWAQYYDKDGPVSYMAEYNIEAIPTMWLLDKNGVISDTDAREDLEEKIEKLLAQPAGNAKAASAAPATQTPAAPGK